MRTSPLLAAALIGTSALGAGGLEDLVLLFAVGVALGLLWGRGR